MSWHKMNRQYSSSSGCAPCVLVASPTAGKSTSIPPYTIDYLSALAHLQASAGGTWLTAEIDHCDTA